MAISSCPDTLFTATFFQVVVESSKLSPQTPFLQTKQLLLLLLILVLQSLTEDICLSSSTFFSVRGLKLNTNSRYDLTSVTYKGTIPSLVLLAPLFLPGFHWLSCPPGHSTGSHSAGHASASSDPNLVAISMPPCKTN